MRIAIVGTGLIGASVALAARGAATRWSAGTPTRPRSPPPSSVGAVTPAASLEEAVAGAELVVVAAPIAQLPGDGRRGAGRERRGDRHRRRLDQGVGRRGRRAARPVRRRPPDRGSETRGAENATRRALRGGDVVPDAGRPHRPGAPPARPRLRLRPRRDAGRDRRRRPRPARRADEPRAARAREHRREPDRRVTRRRATSRSRTPAARCAT